MQDQDLSEALREQVLAALAGGAPLSIVGGGSKTFYGRKQRGEALNVSAHSGIVGYEPTELVLSARAGTPLTVIEAALAEQGQMLAFEPPHFGPSATLGGTVACGLSGPRRPYAGSVRDFVLGIKLLNGKGEILSFGGKVMKNVAGFDLSRLMVGSLGTLGVILEVSLKVLPRPESEATLVFEMTAERALATVSRWSAQSWPLSAASHDGRHLYLRLSGAEAAVRASGQRLGGDPMPEGEGFWEELREHRLAFFAGGRNLWRFSLAPATPHPNLPGDWFTDWGGALRWLSSDAPAADVFEAARAAGGHATMFRSAAPGGQVFQPLPDRLKQLHLDLKRAFDPAGIFNPGRMYEEW